ncbi:hypothetical protein HY224_02585 [Candidatus Uhrbacteria bacterium]|nr:hypothetical protein [Candidatus Uhrbacteria bacterium]
MPSCAERKGASTSISSSGSGSGSGTGTGGGTGTGTMTVLEATRQYVGNVLDKPYAGVDPSIRQGTEGVISINGISGTGSQDPWAGNMGYYVDGALGDRPADEYVLGPGQHSIIWSNAVTGHTICSFTFLI